MEVTLAYIPLHQLVALFCSLLAAGTILTVPLFKFNVRKFLKSALFIKILFWIPIFLVFLAVLYSSNLARIIILALVFLAGLAELLGKIKPRKQSYLLVLYAGLFTVFIGHFYLIGFYYPTGFVGLLSCICFASVLADVTAFFLGNYWGKHKLPSSINKNKSWEGVCGELLGAFFGVILVNYFVIPVVSLWIFLAIGLGCIVGDLLNSYVKRVFDVKDWSHAIPGHGGIVDRLSSIACSAFFVFYFMKIVSGT